MFLSKFGFAVWLLLILIISFNLYVARWINADYGQRSIFKDENGNYPNIGLSGSTLNLLIIAFILILSLIIASKGASPHWDMVLSYLYQQPFGSTDPNI